MEKIREQTALLEEFTATLGFRLTRRGELHIYPPSEEILRIPLALAVSKQDQSQ